MTDKRSRRECEKPDRPIHERLAASIADAIVRGDAVKRYGTLMEGRNDEVTKISVSGAAASRRLDGPVAAEPPTNRMPRRRAAPADRGAMSVADGMPSITLTKKANPIAPSTTTVPG